MLGSRRPSTPDEAFARGRRTFVPRLLLAFGLFALIVSAGDIGRFVSELSFRPQPDPPVARVSVPTASPPPTTAAPSPSPSPVQIRAFMRDGVWVLEQSEDDGEGLSVAYDGSQGIAQTFRAPEDGASLRLIAPSVAVLQGRVTVTVYELDGFAPTDGRRLFQGSLDASAQAQPDRPIRLRSGRWYSFVLRVAPPVDLFDAFVAAYQPGRNVYAGGMPWIDSFPGGWHPLSGDLSFRLEFDPA